MNRPLIKKRIDELELLLEAEHDDQDALQLLQAELSFRSASRATSLLAKVKCVLGGGTFSSSEQQATLFDHKTPLFAEVPMLKETTTTIASPISAMTLEDALTILKVTSGAPWETIEANRCQAVDRARPDRLAAVNEKSRRALKEEAQRANAAYLSLLHRRKT